MSVWANKVVHFGDVFVWKDTAGVLYKSSWTRLFVKFCFTRGLRAFKNYKQLCMTPIVVVESQDVFFTVYIFIAFDAKC